MSKGLPHTNIPKTKIQRVNNHGQNKPKARKTEEYNNLTKR